MRIIKQHIALVVAAATLSACLPSEQSLPIDTSGESTSRSRSSSTYGGALSAETTGPNRIRLTWSASRDPKVVAYNIYDATNRFSPVLLRTVNAPSTSISLTGLENQRLYNFLVRAANEENEEDDNFVIVRGIPYGGILSSEVLSSTSARVTFNNASGADDIQIFCKTASTDFVRMTPSPAVTIFQTQATLTGLTPGAAYTCRAALEIQGYVDNNTQTITFIPIGQASQLVFGTQPGSSNAGVPFAPQPVVRILDTNGNIVSAGPDATAAITISISSNSATTGTVRGTATVNAVAGVATFSGLNIQEAGSKIITATKADTSAQLNGSGVLSVDSNAFTISAGSVSSTTSTIAVTPAGPLIANGSTSYTVTMTLRDAFGNPISNVKPTFSSSISADTLSQASLSTNASGVTTGSLSSTISGTRTLSITSPSGLSTVQASAVFVHGPASRLAFSQQPSNSPAGTGTLAQFQVTVQDAQGNTVTTGSYATSAITISIFVNGGGTGVLNGTTTVNAVAGVADFTGLGIDRTGTGYRLAAAMTPLSPAYSNTFNVTAGVPTKIAINGPSTLLAGDATTCSVSNPFTIQLQDAGNNPANAQANTTIQITGLGQGAFYTSPTCAGASIIGSTLTFPTGSNSRTLYYRNQRAETVNMTAALPGGSTLLTPGTKTLSITPSRVALTGPTSVKAGVCSTAFTITTTGADEVAGPVAANTAFNIADIGTKAALYSDDSCSTSINATGIQVLSGQSTRQFYLKSLKAETLTLNVSDPTSAITQGSTAITFNVRASKITFTGPNTVVAGQPSAPFRVSLKDEEDNLVAVTANTSLQINGLAGKNGKFYSNAGATTEISQVTIPANSAFTDIYLRDQTAETLTLFISDGTGFLTASPSITVGISPSALAITGPGGTSSATNVCRGPFVLRTLDGDSNPTNAISSITANLTGAGTSGAFYSDSNCTTAVTSFTFANGEGSKNFYFLPLYPTASNAPLTFTATDAASVLTTATLNWSVTAARAWVGTSAGVGGGSTANGSAGSPWDWQIGKVPVASRMDGPASARNARLSLNKKYMYISDSLNNRVIKYDLVNKQYIGWIGSFENRGNIGMTGANQATDLNINAPYMTADHNSNCISAVHNSVLPNWCQGGHARPWTGTISDGQLAGPTQVAEDGTYLYVHNANTHTIARYNAKTGQFNGWIGRIESATGLTNGIDENGNTISGITCNATLATRSFTPGWCRGGTLTTTSNLGSVGGFVGDGGLFTVYTMVANPTDGYLYVGVDGRINRYVLSTGAFAGWIGRVQNQRSDAGGLPTGVNIMISPAIKADGSSESNNCSSTSATQQTPGWCRGGLAAQTTGSGAINVPRGILIDNTNQKLFVVDSANSGTILRYNLTTGAFEATVVTGGSPLAFSPTSATWDGTGTLYITEANRILKMSTAGSLLGWVGKILTTASLSQGTGNTSFTCSNLSVSADTPGWCMGGSARTGMTERSFFDLENIDIDTTQGDHKLFTVQGRSQLFPAVKQFNATTGEYLGLLSNTAVTSSNWSDSQSIAGLHGFDERSLYTPQGIHVDGTNLLVAEVGAARLKRMNLLTGETLGWVGGVAGFIPDVTPTTGCGSNPIGSTSGWCLGAYFNPSGLVGGGFSISPVLNTTSTMFTPTGVTSDANYYYVLDRGYNRIMRFGKDGSQKGWTGGISGTPTTGPATVADSSACVGAANRASPGWCVGGAPTSGSQSAGSWSTTGGFLSSPNSILHYNGKLYVTDSSFGRIVRFDAATGVAEDWIGRVNSSTSLSPSPIGFASNTIFFTNGWSTGGTAQVCNPTCVWGGFSWQVGHSTAGLATDGTYLYVANNYNYRIDRFLLSSGVYQGSLLTNGGLTDTWINPSTATTWTAGTAVSLGSFTWDNAVTSIWTTPGSDHLYYTIGQPSSTGARVVKANLTTGNTVGWYGGIGAASPTGGPADCIGATGVTPGWCQGGTITKGYRLGNSNNVGGFDAPVSLTGDDHYLYVGDISTNRITRIPR